MKKIPTLFLRNPTDRSRLLDEVNPFCQWVIDGEGIATRKFDGTCCLIKRGKLYKRREVKKGKAVPDDFIQADHDGITGKAVGWVPVNHENNDDRWHSEAFEENLADGTYELIGPKIQRNPERILHHMLVKHSDAAHFIDAPRNFNDLYYWFDSVDIEGLVFHHKDGRMAKIKKRDYGLKRCPPSKGNAL